MPEPDPTRCPLCGGPNACALAADGADRAAACTDCWCTRVAIPAAVLARVPPIARGTACVCAACAGGAQAKASGPDAPMQA